MNIKAYKDYNLIKGDLIISKDSNIGECIILDEDLNNYMLGSALYKLPITQHKNYIFAFIKSKYFRQQLDEITPKGATIRHAGKKFLECDIFFPNFKDSNEEILNLISVLVEISIEKEKIIKRKNSLIFNLIETELMNNTEYKTVISKTTINDLKNLKELMHHILVKLQNIKKV